MIRRILLATALTAAAVGAAIAPATPALANACPLHNDCVISYWGDVNHTVLVGSEWIDCTGHHAYSGVTSAYMTQTRHPC